jgi:thioredoxin-related protein
MKLALSLMLLLALPAQASEAWEGFFDPFLGDLRAELAEAKRAGRKGVLLMYHFEECPSCTRMKREVLWRPEVQAGFREHFARLAIDTRGAQPVTGLDGSVLPESAFARSQKVRGTPTFDFLDLDGALVHRHVGGIYDPQEFLSLGRRVVQSKLK